MNGSKARARRVHMAVKDTDEWIRYINDLHSKERWTNGGRSIWSVDHEDFIDRALPRGYTYIGQGASRITIRASDGLAYKVSYNSGYDRMNIRRSQNAMEVRAYEALKGVRVKGIRLAKTFQMTPYVNVAEFVEGKEHGSWGVNAQKRFTPAFEKFRDACRARGWVVSDVYADNVKMNKYGTFVVVDLGCFYPIDERY